MARARIKSRLSQDDGLLIAPLLDIIFLVLIFFLLNVNYKGIQSFNIMIPRADMPDNSQPSGRIIVEITDNKSFINGIDVTLSTFTTVLKSEIENTDSTSVLLLGSDEISYKRLIDIIDLVKESGAQAINLGVERR